MLVGQTMEVAVKTTMAGQKWVNLGYVCGLELTGVADGLFVGMKK